MINNIRVKNSFLHDISLKQREVLLEHIIYKIKVTVIL